jgi:hypothetical protein
MRRWGVTMFALLTLLAVAAGPAAAAENAATGFGVSAGIATGDNNLDTGWIIGADYESQIHFGRVVLRGDFTYQSHDPDFTMWGLAANAMLPLTRFYVLGGFGIYNPDPGDMKLGVQFGGGMYILPTKLFFVEARVEAVEDFTSIPIVLGVRF